MIKTKEEVDIENRALKRKVLLEMELKKIVEALIAKYKPGKIFLFGSLAEGKIHEWSDIDIVIVKATNKRFMDRLKEVALMCDYSVGVNFFVYTPEEILEAINEGNYFIKNEVLRKGKLLYEGSQSG